MSAVDSNVHTGMVMWVQSKLGDVGWFEYTEIVKWLQGDIDMKYSRMVTSIYNKK